VTCFLCDVAELEADMRSGLDFDDAQDLDDYRTMLALCGGEEGASSSTPGGTGSAGSMPVAGSTPGGGGGGGQAKDRWSSFGGAMTLPRAPLPPTDILWVQRRAAAAIVRFMKVSHTRLALERLRTAFGSDATADADILPYATQASPLEASFVDEEEDAVPAGETQDADPGIKGAQVGVPVVEEGREAGAGGGEAICASVNGSAHTGGEGGEGGGAGHGGDCRQHWARATGGEICWRGAGAGVCGEVCGRRGGGGGSLGAEATVSNDAGADARWWWWVWRAGAARARGYERAHVTL